MLRPSVLFFRNVIAHAVLLIGCVAAQTSLAQRNFLERRTFNEGFESGLSSWTTNGSVQVIPWDQLPMDPDAQLARNSRYLTEPDDTVNLVANDFAVRLTGPSNIYQYAPVNGKADYQLIICNGRKRRVEGSNGELGWAGYGVTYFDANWNPIDSQERQIFDVKIFNINFSPGYSQSSEAFPIPAGAVHSILWLANDGTNTELYADDVALFNLFQGQPFVNPALPVGERFTQDPSEKNLVLNSELVSTWQFDLDPNNLSSPGRFTTTGNDPAWQKSGTRFEPVWGVFGGEPTFGTGEAAYWQNVRLEPGTSYDLVNRFVGRGQFTFGIDIYDANWNYLETQSIESDPFDSGLPFDLREKVVQFTASAEAVNASVWVWYGPGNASIANNLVMESTTLSPASAE